MTFFRHLLILPLLIGALIAQADNQLNLTPAQQAELEKSAPGVSLTPELAEKLRAIAYDQSRSLDDRIDAMQKAAGFSQGEPLKRRICIWDIAGRAGPIFKLQKTSVHACCNTVWTWMCSPTPAKAWLPKTSRPAFVMPH